MDNKNLSMQKLIEKYSNIEDKIPSVWSDYEKAGIELAQDIAFEWDIKDPELIRVISLVEMRMVVTGKPKFGLGEHIYQPFAFVGLYPERIKTFNIKPESNG